MVQINFAKREVQCKVVYYGPSMSGKTANLRQIHERSPEKVRGALTTIATDTDRTLFFDFLPLNIGLVGDVRAKINLYAIPYIEAQNTLRLLVLEGVDGIVFVADSAPNKLRANMAALENLHENLARLGRDLRDIPLVFQWNKRDIKEALPVLDLTKALNQSERPAFEAAASMGAGVFQTLKAITHAVLVDVTKMIVATPAQARAPEPAAFAPPPVEPEPAPEPMRIRAVASRERTPQPAFEETAQPPVPGLEAASAAGSRMEFDDVALPPTAVKPEEQEAHETPMVPPWRRAPDRPAVRSQAEEFAEHLSTDSFGAHASPRAAAQSAHASPRAAARSAPAPTAQATPDLPQRDVARAADRAVPAPRIRRTAETETALEPAAAADPGGWDEYTDPPSVDLQAASGGWDQQPATGSVRVRGPVGGWEETRRVRDARPVVDRRKRPRRENVEVLSKRSLLAGSLFSLFLLVVIGYLVHALL